MPRGSSPILSTSLQLGRPGTTPHALSLTIPTLPCLWRLRRYCGNDESLRIYEACTRNLMLTPSVLCSADMTTKRFWVGARVLTLYIIGWWGGGGGFFFFCGGLF